MARLRNKEFPWCTCCLVTICIACHTCVLIGNLATASAMQALGTSTGGWSRVGLGLSRSFQIELDVLMGNVTDQLLGVIGQMDNAMSGIDNVLSMIGDAAEGAAAQSESQALLLIQEKTVTKNGQPTFTGNINELVTGTLVPLVMNTVQTVMDQGMNQLNTLIQRVVDMIRPPLLQVGHWIVSFGPQIQRGIEGFSVALDRVQKIFDQIMANLNGHGNNGDDMLHEAFGLFDVSQSGSVTIQDLRDMAELFSLTGLQGTKPEELVETYDNDGDGQLSRAETRLMVEDSSVPNIMATVLRTYARKLSEVAGHVGDAVMRKPLSRNVVQYFQLVCAKNQTKVGWVSDALGNASLPVDFTASVYAQLCLQEHDPDVLTNQDVGQRVISRMYALHQGHTQNCFDRMTSPEFWTTNGFNPLDQPRCIERVTRWFVEAELNETGLTLEWTPPGAFLQTALAEASTSVAKAHSDSHTSAALIQEAASRKKAVLRAMPAVARRMAEANTRSWLVQKQQKRAAVCASRYRSATAQHLKNKLLGGQPASASSGSLNPNVEQAVNGGQPAAPETLVFAAYLAANATATADRLQDMCMTYSSESSNPIDTFATQIQSLVSKTASFIEMMMTYATPAGIARLEEMVMDFITNAAEQVRETLQERVEELITDTVRRVTDALPAVDAAIGNGMEAAADAIEAAAAPVEEAVDGLLNVTSGLLGDESTAVISGVVDTLESTLANVVDGLRHGELPLDIIGGIPGMPSIPGLTLMEQQRLTVMEQQRATKALMEQPGATEVDAPDATGPTTIIGQVVSVLRSLTNLMPTATSTLTLAQEEVSRASSVMDSLFDMLGGRAPGIFNTISLLYRVLWIVYFCIFVPLTLCVLYYGLWAGGYLGGPKPLVETGEERYQPPRTCWQRLQVCCSSCCFCCQKCHDTQLCLWSTVLFMQIIILILFVVSIVLCILAGVKAFISAGCAQVYLLSDPSICTNTIAGIQGWLTSYFVNDAVEALDEICPSNDLLTCQLIASRMRTSVILTTIFSFLAVIMSLQILIESAVLHEHARYRRLFMERTLEAEELEKTRRMESTGV